MARGGPCWHASSGHDQPSPAAGPAPPLAAAPAARGAARRAAVPAAVHRPGALDPRRPGDHGRAAVRGARRRRRRGRRGDRVGRAVPAVRGAGPAGRRVGRPATTASDPHRLGRRRGSLCQLTAGLLLVTGTRTRDAPGGPGRRLRGGRRVLRPGLHRAAARHRLAGQPAAGQRAARAELLDRLDRRAGARRPAGGAGRRRAARSSSTPRRSPCPSSAWSRCARAWSPTCCTTRTPRPPTTHFLTSLQGGLGGGAQPVLGHRRSSAAWRRTT